MISAVQMRERLKRAVTEAGSQARWAAANGVSPQYVCDALHGRREIGEGISRPLGMVPVTVYISVKLADNVLRKGRAA